MVVIKDFEMPKKCNDCSLMVNYHYGSHDNAYALGRHCIVTSTKINHVDIRPKDCPLIEIKPHECEE